MGKRAVHAAEAHAEKKNKLIKGASQQAAAPANTATAAKPGWAEDDDVPFPRGGGSAITPLERREAKLDARRDFLAEQQQGSGGERKAGKRKKEEASTAEEEEEDVVMGALNAGDEISRADVLRPADLTVGLRVLGAVSDVSSGKLSIQLPCQLSGAVAADDVSDELHAALASGELEKAPDLRRIFKLGELLICVVTAPPVPHVDKSRQARRGRLPATMPPPSDHAVAPLVATCRDHRARASYPHHRTRLRTHPPALLTWRAPLSRACGRALPPSCRCGSLSRRAPRSRRRPRRGSASARSCGRRSSRSRSTAG